MSWLIITEKDNTAKRLSSILFGEFERKKKFNVNYYYSKTKDAYVLGLKGHIVELDFPQEYNNWGKVSLNSLLKAEVIKKVKEERIVKLLEYLGKQVDRVTIATDYDREGELIGLEAVEIIKKVNPDVRIDRVRYSALTPPDIKKAFSKPDTLNINLAKSAETRQIIDLYWGAILTRLLSISSGRLGKDFLSVGRVQSPTLRLIVERETEIREFKPKKYWEIIATFNSSGGIEFIGKHLKRFDEKNEASKALGNIRDYGIVREFKEVERVDKKPTPFNTTEFLKEASRFMSPDRAMNVAENLYINGYISYPRTDNTVYPKSLNLKRIVKSFLNSSFKDCALIALEDMNPSKGKKETTDHPPIYPTAVAEKSELSKDEWRIYELIVRRFLASLAPNAIWRIRRTLIDVNGEMFTSSGRELIKKGWREIYVYVKSEESYLPYLRIGERIRILSKKLLEKETKPPSRYSSGSLIKLMERLNLGTKSTRHEIIKKLYSRKYVQGNPLIPTETAFAVIDALKKCAETITLPDMTSKLEIEMDGIEEGRIRQEDVVRESKNFLEKILKAVNVEELSKTLKEGIRRDKILGKCPKCEGELVIRKARGKFVGCSSYPDCKFSLPLPKKGKLNVISKECDKHKMRMIRIKQKNKNWTFCPYCNYLEWINNR